MTPLDKKIKEEEFKKELLYIINSFKKSLDQSYQKYKDIYSKRPLALDIIENSLYKKPVEIFNEENTTPDKIMGDIIKDVRTISTYMLIIIDKIHKESNKIINKHTKCLEGEV